MYASRGEDLPPVESTTSLTKKGEGKGTTTRFRENRVLRQTPGEKGGSAIDLTCREKKEKKIKIPIPSRRVSRLSETVEWGGTPNHRRGKEKKGGKRQFYTRNRKKGGRLSYKGNEKKRPASSAREVLPLISTKKEGKEDPWGGKREKTGMKGGGDHVYGTGKGGTRHATVWSEGSRKKERGNRRLFDFPKKKGERTHDPLLGREGTNFPVISCREKREKRKGEEAQRI